MEITKADKAIIAIKKKNQKALNLPDVVLQPRLALCRIDQYVAVIQLKPFRKLRVDLCIKLAHLCCRKARCV